MTVTATTTPTTQTPTNVQDTPVQRRVTVPIALNWVLGTVGVALFLLALELLPTFEIVNPTFLPPISDLGKELAAQAMTGGFWIALGQTVLTWSLGLAISVVAGVAVGVAIGSNTFLREFTASTVEFLRPVPSVALIPVVVLLLGSDMPSTLMLVIYASFWQVLIQVLAGVQDVDPVASDTARSFRFSTATRLRTLVWPTTMPYAMTGLRLAASVALILTVTGELLISGDGIGGRIAVARESSANEQMYAFVIVAGALGVLVNLAARVAEQRFLFWHSSVRGEVAS